MDLATLVGLVGGFIVVAIAMFMGGDPLIYLNIPSVFIVFFASMFIVAMKFSVKQLPNAVKVAIKAFFIKLDNSEALIEKCVELAGIAKKGGPLALEKVEIENGFLKKGVDMLVDSYDPKVIRDILMKERNLAYQRHTDGQKIFNALNDVAPAMGMIGTLIGLVAMLQNMSDPKSIGPAMAVALLTTLYGAIIANMFAKPIADKLELRAEEEALNQALIVDAIMSIQAGMNPRVLHDALSNYLPQAKRVSADQAKKAA